MVCLSQALALAVHVPLTAPEEKADDEQDSQTRCERQGLEELTGFRRGRDIASGFCGAQGANRKWSHHSKVD
jgi:hypothetical protein